MLHETPMGLTPFPKWKRRIMAEHSVNPIKNGFQRVLKAVLLLQKVVRLPLFFSERGPAP
jgi:hypothetical protein